MIRGSFPGASRLALLRLARPGLLHFAPLALSPASRRWRFLLASRLCRFHRSRTNGIRRPRRISRTLFLLALLASVYPVKSRVYLLVCCVLQSNCTCAPIVTSNERILPKCLATRTADERLLLFVANFLSFYGRRAFNNCRSSKGCSDYSNCSGGFHYYRYKSGLRRRRQCRCDLTNDFIEIFNRGNSTIDVAGWSVQYASSTGRRGR